MNGKLRQRLGGRRVHRYLALVFRLVVGGVFIYASMAKINYTGEFAEIIAAYQLVPFWAVNLLAVTLPWAELICGLMMVAGVRSKAAAIAISAMLGVFTVAIVISLLRQTPIDCGCFHNIDEPMTWTTAVRDLIWLTMSAHIYLFDDAFQLENKFLLAVREI